MIFGMTPAPRISPGSANSGVNQTTLVNEVTTAIQFVELMDRVRAGDAAAAQSVWNLYHPAVIRLLRKRLPSHRRRDFDEDDVAASAFLSFFDGIAANRFPDLTEPNNLWSLLAVIAGRKALSYLRHHVREKRGGGQLRGESVFGTSEHARRHGIEQVSDQEQSPESVTEFLDDVDHLLGLLGNDTLQKIALLKLDGSSIDEIAAEVGITRRAVERRLAVIRQTWRESVIQPEPPQ